MFVRDRMSSPAVKITPDMPFQDALKLMHSHGFRRLPIKDRHTVLEIMTHHVVTVTPQTPIRVACELVLKHEISALPVVIEGRLVGILTDSDIFRLVTERWFDYEAVRD
jgi:acetoin utilization protein AcuB